MKRTDFSVDWLFAACAPDTELLPWNAQFTPVDLPHDWQIRHADDLYRDGTLFYRKYFFVTDVPGTRRMLWFGGAYMDTTVFVNGTEVGQWKYGYTSFWFDITDALHEGQNEVLVRCNLRHPNSRWYSGAGLYRNVELWEAPDLHLMPDGLYVAAKEGDNGAWTVAVTAEVGSVTAASAGRTLTLYLTDDNGSLLGTAAIPADAWAALPSPDGWRTGKETAIYKASHTFTLQDPALWDLDAPNFYHITAELTGADGVTDTLTTRFGCRTIEATPDCGLLVNHKRVLIKGVCIHHDFGCLGSAFEYSAAKRQLEILKSMGVNSIRTGHTPPAPQFMDLADEMGILMDVESFDCWRSGKNPYDYGRFFDEWQEKDVAAWVRRDRNHPSLLFWCIGNEIYDTHAGSEGADTMRMLLAEVAAHDPARNGIPTLGSNYMPWEIHSTVLISSRSRAIITASASTPATTRSTPTGSSTAVRRRPSCRAAASTTSRFRKACCLMMTCSAQAWATAAQVGARRAGMSACRASSAGRSRWGSTFGPGGITSASRHLTTRAAAISARLTRQASRRTPTTLCRPRGSTPKHIQWYTCSPTGTSTKGS